MRSNAHWPQDVPWYYRIGAELARKIPTAVSYPVGLAVADIVYALWASKRQAADRNFARVLGLPADHPRVRQTSRRAFRNFGKNIVELLHAQGMELEDVARLVTVEGAEHWFDAVNMGRGIIFVSAHFGGMDMVSALPMLYGYQMTAVAKPQKPKLLMNWLTVCRARAGITLVTAKNPALTLLRELRRQRPVALVIDVGAQNGVGVPVRFCGTDTVFPAGPAMLARWSGAPLVFGLAVRTPGNRFKVCVTPPVLPEQTEDSERDVQAVTQKLVNVLEQFVQRYPDQWYIFRDMWPLDGARPCQP